MTSSGKRLNCHSCNFPNYSRFCCGITDRIYFHSLTDLSSKQLRKRLWQTPGTCISYDKCCQCRRRCCRSCCCQRCCCCRFPWRLCRSRIADYAALPAPQSPELSLAQLVIRERNVDAKNLPRLPFHQGALYTYIFLLQSRAKINHKMCLK